MNRKIQNNNYWYYYNYQNYNYNHNYISNNTTIISSYTASNNIQLQRPQLQLLLQQQLLQKYHCNNYYNYNSYIFYSNYYNYYNYYNFCGSDMQFNKCLDKISGVWPSCPGYVVYPMITMATVSGTSEWLSLLEEQPLD